MPRYDFECHNPDCGKVEERLLPLARSDEPQTCSKCGHYMAKVHLRAPAGFVSNAYVPYKCPITGATISGKKAHEENLAKHGCRVLEKGEREAAEKRRKADDDALDRAIEGTVEREITLMPGDKRQALENELKHGAEATFERSTRTK